MASANNALMLMFWSFCEGASFCWGYSYIFALCAIGDLGGTEAGLDGRVSLWLVWERATLTTKKREKGASEVIIYIHLIVDFLLVS